MTRLLDLASLAVAGCLTGVATALALDLPIPLIGK